MRGLEKSRVSPLELGYCAAIQALLTGDIARELVKHQLVRPFLSAGVTSHNRVLRNGHCVIKRRFWYSSFCYPKRGGPKEKNLYPALLEDLAWLRDHQRAEPDHYVFRRPGQKLAAFRQWFDARLKKYARKAGHPTYVHPHLVRASAATDHSERGVPDRDIMLQGGWRTLSSLRKYLREDDGARRERMEAGCDL